MQFQRQYRHKNFSVELKHSSWHQEWKILSGAFLITMDPQRTVDQHSPPPLPPSHQSVNENKIATFYWHGKNRHLHKIHSKVGEKIGWHLLFLQLWHVSTGQHQGGVACEEHQWSWPNGKRNINSSSTRKSICSSITLTLRPNSTALVCLRLIYVIVENSWSMVCCSNDAAAIFFLTSPMIDRT